MLKSFIVIVYMLGVFYPVCSQIQTQVYWTDPSYNIIYRLEGNEAIPVVSEGLGFPWRLAYYNNKIYWSNIDKNLVQRANTDGSDIEDLAVITYPQGIAVDPRNGDVYIADTGSPAIIRLDGRTLKADSIIISGLSDPDDLHLDPEHDRIFWIDNANSTINTANTDGTDMSVILLESIDKPRGIAIDYYNNLLFWSDETTKAIYSLDLKTKEKRQIVSNLEKPESLAYNNLDNSLYWVDIKAGAIKKIMLDTKIISVVTDKEISKFHVGLLLVNK